jgi:hypothetical protein
MGDPKLCYLCKDAGRKQAAHRILSGGKGVCNEHLASMTDPASVCAVSVTTMPPAVPSVSREPSVNSVLKENSMSTKVAIDEKKLRELHAQGLSDRAIGEKLGVSGATILTRRRALGLAPGKRGRRAVSGNGTKPRRAPQPKLHRKAAKPAANGDGVVTLCLSEAAIDGLWNGLSLEVKGEWIEKILG